MVIFTMKGVHIMQISPITSNFQNLIKANISKKTSKKNVISVIMIIFLVLASIVLADRSYRLRKYEKLDYKETATTNYKVYLDDDSYYNSAFLIYIFIFAIYTHIWIFFKKFDIFS